MMFAEPTSVWMNSVYSPIWIFTYSLSSSFCLLFSVSRYGAMFKRRESVTIWIGKSSELRKFWYWYVMASCSSADLSAKLMDEHMTRTRKLPSFRTTTSSLMESIESSCWAEAACTAMAMCEEGRSEEHTSELQSHVNLVCRLLLEKKQT